MRFLVTPCALSLDAHVQNGDQTGCEGSPHDPQHGVCPLGILQVLTFAVIQRRKANMNDVKNLRVSALVSFPDASNNLSAPLM